MPLISTSYSFPVFPLDVFMVIMDALASDPNILPISKLQGLISLSATCWMLVEPARKCIFRTVTIRSFVPRPTWMTPDDLPSITFETMAMVLQRNPSIAKTVRTLNCQLILRFANGLIIGNILRQFTHLRSLALMAHEHFQFSAHRYHSEDDSDQEDLFYGINEQFINWRHMAPALQDAIRTLMHLPTLTTLELGKVVNFPIEVLERSQGLHTLNLNRCRLARPFTQFSSIPSHSRQPQSVPLQVLRITPGASSNVERLKCSRFGTPILDLSQIRELSFTFTTEFDDAQLANLLAELPRLEILSVIFKGPGRYEVRPSPSSLSLAATPATREGYFLDNLRTLRIQHDVLENCYALDSLLGVSSFKELHDVEVYLMVYPGMTGNLVSNLGDFAEDLSIESKFPVLESVSISICLDEDGESSDSSEEDEEKEDREAYKEETRSVWQSLRTTELAPLSALGTVCLSYSVKEVDGNIIV
ncbi:hypothetical protein GALMADRAFT_232301 [Galerina marginata CBS 339.88]|uniref:F-box domain-containing protein n=1 Tax=Galerina marginata (strain CBS 339.88) TaxID=685588 RepID=A0A067S7T9_GALM3|nr:hypothetical protein GALMADRAFT_232301 [Galerina marginata CBS 339.88]